jgi:hypothetical protein
MGRILAAGPAWSIDVAQFISRTREVIAIERTVATKAVCVPANARWITYVIRGDDTTYIAREQNELSSEIAAAEGDAVTFKIDGAYLIWQTASGRKHTAHLVIR